MDSWRRWRENARYEFETKNLMPKSPSSPFFLFVFYQISVKSIRNCQKKTERFDVRQCTKTIAKEQKQLASWTKHVNLSCTIFSTRKKSVTSPTQIHWSNSKMERSFLSLFVLSTKQSFGHRSLSQILIFSILCFSRQPDEFLCYGDCMNPIVLFLLKHSNLSYITRRLKAKLNL